MRGGGHADQAADDEEPAHASITSRDALALQQFQRTAGLAMEQARSYFPASLLSGILRGLPDL
jgi:hypothetical protein